MAIETLVPYEETTKKFIPEQYKNSARLLGIINSILAQCDDLEIAFFEILEALSLQDAIGPALDYIGAVVGVERIVGETDESYRTRIIAGKAISGLPTPEALRNVIKFVTGIKNVGLYPCWPAGMYFVLGGTTTVDLSVLESESMTSGAALGRGTFLRGELGDDIGYIINEDNGMPFVIDWHPLYNGYQITDESDVPLLTENDEPLLVE